MRELDKVGISSTLFVCSRDVVRCVSVGSGVLSRVPFARSAAFPLHTAPAQSGSIYAHRHPRDGCRWANLWGCPHQ